MGLSGETWNATSYSAQKFFVYNVAQNKFSKGMNVD